MYYYQKEKILAFIVLSTIFLTLSLYGDTSLIPYRVKDKYGFNSLSQRKVIINCQYQDIIPFKKGHNTTWVKEKGLWKLINKSGKPVIAQFYDKIKFPASVYYPVRKNNLWGAMDRLGNVIVKCRYEDMSRFFHGLAMFKLNNKWGILNNTGKIIIKPQYENLRILSDRLFACFDVNKRNYFCLNINNKKLFIISGTPEGRYSDGLLKVRCKTALGARIKYIDKEGKTIIPPSYYAGQRFNNQLASVAKYMKDQKIKWGYINTKNKIIIPFEYEEAAPFDVQNSLAPVKKNGKWGIINTQGKIVIPLRFDQIGYFKNGLAPIRIKKKWGYINLKGDVVIPLKYQYAFPFKEGIAYVIKNKNGGYIDIKGKEYWQD